MVTGFRNFNIVWPADSGLGLSSAVNAPAPVAGQDKRRIQPRPEPSCRLFREEDLLASYADLQEDQDRRGRSFVREEPPDSWRSRVLPSAGLPDAPPSSRVLGC